MVTPSRYVAIAALASFGGGSAVSPAFADSINLLRPATRALSPSIMIETVKRSSGDDQASASIDQDCVVIDDRSRNSAARLDSARFNFGQLAWSWDESADASVIYILCVDPKQEPPSFGSVGGGGGGMTAAWSWPGAAPVNRGGAGATPETLALNSDRPILAVAPITSPATNTGDPAATDTSGAGPTGTPASPPSQPAETDLAITDAVSALFSSGAIGSLGGSGGGFGGGTGAPAMAPFDPAISLEPEQMPPVPEPGTWLLLGTGLAAAWRARRHK